MAVYEYKLLHGRADKVEANLNELVVAGWEFVTLTSGSGGLMGALLDISGGSGIVVVRRTKETP